MIFRSATLAVVVSLAACSTQMQPMQDQSLYQRLGDTAHGRPVGLALDTKGNVLVADDTGSTIWRISGAP